MKYAWIATTLCLAACATGPALALQQGQPAPAAVVEQIKDAPVVHIGSHSVRAVPAAVLGAQGDKRAQAAGMAQASPGKTLVVREGDHLVGISAHELVVITTDLEAVAATLARLQLPGASSKSYPQLQLLIIKTARFEQLQTVRDQLAAAFPQAKFDMPVTYFVRKPR